MSRDKVKEYFPHDEDATDDPKMMIMISQLGLEGYGIYWVLIEYLRKQPGYTAPLMIVDSLARRFGSSREKFEVVITKYNDSFPTPLFVINKNTFYSPSLQNRMLRLDEKREKMKTNALKRWAGDANVMQLHSESIPIAMQSKVKDSKVKDSKVEKSKEEKEKDLLNRKRAFFSEVEKFTQYPGEMLQSFFDYWTETNKSGTRMKFELERTFEVSKRLSTWAQREKTFKK